MTPPPTIETTHGSGSRLGTIVLALAGAVALVAVGAAVLRGGAARTQPPDSQAAAAPMPDVGQMIAQLEAKLKGNTTDAGGWRMLGWSYFETGRYAEAAHAYRTAATIDPTQADYWSALGEATVLADKAGVTPPATEAFRKAVVIDPKDPRARYYLGIARDMAGDHRGAIDDWIALLKDTPAGAPYEQSVREVIARVAAANGIDVAGRVPAPAAPPAGSATAVATDGIPGPTPDQMRAAAQLPPGQQDAMVKGMVDGLAARLAANPKDPDGWIRLIRARMVLGDAAGAKSALAAARQAFVGDAAQQARLSEAAQALGATGK